GHRPGSEPDGQSVAVDADLDVLVERHDHETLPRGQLVGCEERTGSFARGRFTHEHRVVAGGCEGQRLEACGTADGQARLGGVAARLHRARWYQPSSAARVGASAAMLSTVIGSRTSWTWPTPSCAKVRSVADSVSGSPGIRSNGSSVTADPRP